MLSLSKHRAGFFNGPLRQSRMDQYHVRNAYHEHSTHDGTG